MLSNLLASLRYVKNKNLHLRDALSLSLPLRSRDEVTIHPRLSQRPLTLRRGGSDRAVFDQVFVQRAYDTDFGLEPKTIVDAGANFGASTVFFATRFPNAQILAIEPSHANMNLTRRNCAGLSGVSFFEQGLYHSDRPLRIKNPDCGREWAFQVEECDEDKAEFHGISVGMLLKRLNWSHIDLLKIDIEGAELEVFSHDCDSWMDRVNVLVIELHDFCRPGCSEAFFRALQHFPQYTSHLLGENLIIKRRQFLA